MWIAIDNSTTINMEDLEQNKYCAINHKGKVFCCPSCGYENVRCKSGSIRKSHFFHTNNKNTKHIYENCPYYCEKNLSKKEKKQFEGVKKNIDYIYNNWIQDLKSIYHNHILATNIPKIFVCNNIYNNVIENENRYIYFISSYLEEESFNKIINQHKETDKIYFIFLINETIRPYPNLCVNTNVITAKFTGKNELPFFVDYEHNYNLNARQNIQKYKNVKVYIDNNKDILLKVNFNNCNNGYEVFPINLVDIINTDFKGFFDKVPKREKWFEMYNLMITVDNYIPPSYNDLKKQGKKKCNKCDYIYDYNIHYASCTNCRKKWGNNQKKTF